MRARHGRTGAAGPARRPGAVRGTSPSPRPARSPRAPPSRAVAAWPRRPGAAWLAGTAELAWARIAPGPRTPRRGGARCCATSALMPCGRHGLVARRRAVADAPRGPPPARTPCSSTATARSSSTSPTTATRPGSSRCPARPPAWGGSARPACRPASSPTRAASRAGSSPTTEVRAVNARGRGAARAARAVGLLPARGGGRLRLPQAGARADPGRGGAARRGPGALRRHRRHRRGRRRRHGPPARAASSCRRRGPAPRRSRRPPRWRPTCPRRSTAGAGVTHVLAVRLDNDGDVLLAGPAVRALAARRRPRDAALRAARRARGRAAARASTPSRSGARHGSIPTPTRSTRPTSAALVARLAALRLDAAVIFGSFHQSPLPTALVLRLAGVPFDRRRPPSTTPAPARRPPPDRRRRARGGARARPGRGRRVPGRRPATTARWPCGAVRPSWATDGYVVVHPGASVPARAWAPERHAALVARARRRRPPRRRHRGTGRGAR